MFYLGLKFFKKIKQFVFTLIVKKKCKSYILPLKVNKRTYVTNKTILGKNVNFNGLKIKSRGYVTIGDNFHSGEDCLIITDIHKYDFAEKIPYDNTYIIKDLVIEDNVWLGDKVIILGGVKIGEGSIIQAGSVVVNNIPPYSIAGGHPAKVFSQRDIKNYHKLKKEGKFH